MPDYKNGKIYMIESAIHGGCYYGSTCSPLAKRFYGHKNDSKRYKDGKRNYTTSFVLFDYDDVRIILVEAFPCDNKMELIAREAKYIRENKCLNKVIPCRSSKEYYQDNKEKITVFHKEYRKNNKEKIAVLHKEYRKNNKEKIAVLNKEYRKNNKEKIADLKKKHYQISKIKVKCECGHEVRKHSLPNHKKSKKHKSLIELLRNDI